MPYFRALHENFDPDYKIGVYGTRNTCTQVCDNGYALTSFVSDISYGFSGNMGFKIPENWNLDQFYELSTSETGWDFDLDRTTYSGRYPVVDYIQHRTYIKPAIPEVETEITQTTLGALNAEIYERMNGVLEKAGLLLLKGGNPTQEVNTACCDSFANYIYKMINQ